MVRSLVDLDVKGQGKQRVVLVIVGKADECRRNVERFLICTLVEAI